MMAAEKMTQQWNFAELIAGICYLRDATPEPISGLSLDSRQVQPGDLFFACEGGKVHAKSFISQAIEGGARVVMWESPLTRSEVRDGVPVFGVPDLRQLIGPIAERFYGSPSQQQFVVGITGTNGKTSVSQFVAQALGEDGPCGMLGTLGNGLFGQLEAGTHTTPDAITLHALLASLREQGAERVVMEVSSHGLEQGRAVGVHFDVAVFTNLSHEHLDYHGDMRAYGLAKRRLFESRGLKYAVINIDDDYGRELLTSLPGAVGTVSYGFKGGEVQPSLLGSDLQLGRHGLRLQVQSDWGSDELQVPLLGGFNAYNLLAALGVLLAAGIPFDEALQRLAKVQPVPGRMEGYGGDDGQPLVVVDYAHTPDALEQVLKALRAHAEGQLWCVFGCGGDRDRSKRPLMAKVAEQHADRVVVTDDNPRTENSGVIVADILGGFVDVDTVTVIADRARAITEAIAKAEPQDVVLVAGKGHEDYQLIGEQRQPFSDAAEVLKALAQRGGRS
jgi:UDP-N-acetylmuramoyl-L-alanyl-D-glutamate--2,6-diaminopimelate ligase